MSDEDTLRVLAFRLDNTRRYPDELEAIKNQADSIVYVAKSFILKSGRSVPFSWTSRPATALRSYSS